MGGREKDADVPATAGPADDAATAAPSRGPRPAARVDRASCVRRCAASHTLLPAGAIGAPRFTGQRIAVTVFDERVDAREQYREHSRGDRAPQREHQEADATAQAAAHEPTLASHVPTQPTSALTTPALPAARFRRTRRFARALPRVKGWAIRARRNLHATPRSSGIP